jgi:DNA-binding MarR family transcriptional regulator
MLTVEMATNASSAPAALDMKNLVKRRKHAATTARIVKLSVTPKTAALLAWPPAAMIATTLDSDSERLECRVARTKR